MSDFTSNEEMEIAIKDLKPRVEHMAFPLVIDKTQSIIVQGLTKRELFAAMSMQGILSRDKPGATTRDIADLSIHMADVLLNELSKKQGEPNANN